MSVFVLSLIFVVLAALFSFMLSENKHEFYFYLFSFCLILSPSTKIFGLYSDSFFNANINQFIIYFLVLAFPFNIIINSTNKNKFPFVIKVYYRKIGRLLIFVLFSFIVNMFLNSIFYDISIFSFPKYHFVEYVSFFVLLHASFSLLNKINPKRVLIILRNIWISILVFSSLLGILYSWNVESIIDLQELAYNFNFTNTISFLETAIESANYLNRSYSVFGGSNQYSVLATSSLVLFYFFYKRKILTRRLFIILIIFQILVLISSLSRTGFLLYIIVSFVIISQNSKHFINYILYTSLVLITLYFSLSFLDARIQNIFDFDIVVVSFFTERGYYWALFFEIISNSFESIFLGLYSYYKETKSIFFENGYLNLWAEGGLITLLLHFVFYFTLMKWFKNSSTTDKSLSRSIFNYLFAFCIFEIFLGTFVAFRFEAINAITIATFFYLKIAEKNLKINTQ